MNQSDYDQIQEISRRRIRETSLDTKRFLADRIDWRDRLIAINGARGTGKTTLLLQHIKEVFSDNPDTALYISLDNLWFETHSLVELADFHEKCGGTHIFIDEAHYLNNWQRSLKSIYDDYTNLHIVYTGSSLLRLSADGGDLSRRQLSYTLPGLSFREYLYFEGIGKFEPLTLPELLENHLAAAEEITEKCRVLKFFRDYLAHGYYPFYKEVYAGYYERMMQITNQILERDYPAVKAINYSTTQKIRKMLYILAQSCPQTPNMSELYRELDTDRNQGLKMLYILERANLLSLLSSEKNSLKNMARPDKIYCDNTNLMFALTENINTGTKRETFFLNQVRSAGHEVLYPKQGDFLVDGKHLFEVGGNKKSFRQIKDVEGSYLAVDDEEIGRRNRIPLWIFGFLY